jgi:hypothetical protein
MVYYSLRNMAFKTEIIIIVYIIDNTMLENECVLSKF